MNAQLVIQKFLRTRYEASKAKNPSYSIRAFAKHAGVSPATLSRILNGKRIISRKLADQISERLMLDPQERAELLEHFPKRNAQTDEVEKNALQLTADQYQVVADWRAYAILGLTEIAGFKNDPDWIAARLNAPPQDVKKLIERLLRLEMIEEVDGTLKRSAPRYRTTDDVANLSLRKSHYQTLELAKTSLDNDAVEDRDFSWITFPLDKKKLPEAKTLIRQFQKNLYKMMDEDAAPTEVYRLAVQFFPLTKKNLNK